MHFQTYICMLGGGSNILLSNIDFDLFKNITRDYGIASINTSIL